MHRTNLSFWVRQAKSWSDREKECWAGRKGGALFYLKSNEMQQLPQWWQKALL